MKALQPLVVVLTCLASACGGGSASGGAASPTSANQAPQIAPAPDTITVIENTTTVTRISAEDADGDRVEITLSGDDAARFNLDTDGDLAFVETPDFESPSDSDGDNLYEVTVQASDGNATSEAIGLLIRVENDDTDDFELSAPGFATGTAMPLIHACESLGGENYSPQLSWRNVPAGVHRFALIVDDETAPCGTDANACVHWNLFNIDGAITRLTEDVDPSSLVDANGASNVVEGLTYASSNDYEGPCPPPGNVHTYTFALYALSADQPTMTRLDALTRSEFEEAYAANVLGRATLTGTFSN